MPRYYEVLVEDHFVRRSLVTVEANSYRELTDILEFYEDEIMDEYRVGSSSYVEYENIKELAELSETDKDQILYRSEYDKDLEEQKDWSGNIYTPEIRIIEKK